MADFPTSIFTPRTTENQPGISYDPAKTKIQFAEDYSLPAAEIAAIEATLGINPQGAYATVRAWLDALAAAVPTLVWGSITGTLSDQTDLQTALNAKQNSLGFTAENVANKSTSVTTDQASNTKYPSVKAVFDWATATFQAALGYTAENVANKQTDLTASATKYPTVDAVNTGLALKQNSLGFTAENVANKQTDLTASATKYPTVNAVNTGLALKQDSLGFTAENVANKSTSVTTDQASNTKYPSVKAVFDWATATFQAALGYTAENVANKSTSGALGTSDTLYPSQKAVKTYVDAAIPAGVPTGAVFPWTTSSAPTGYALCDGSSQLRAGTYAALFAVIGSTFGSVDGTHFTLPDLRGRVPVGQKTGTFATLGATGGEETHVLTIAEMPAHKHTAFGAGSGGPGAVTQTGFSNSPNNVMNATGGDGAHNNLQPYIVLYYIIKL